MISSFVVLIVKEDDDATLRLKERLILYRNGDKDRFTVRRDFCFVDHSVARILLSLAKILQLNLATADVLGVCMHLGPITRELFVRSPQAFLKQGTFWKLHRLPYGIVEAGRQWVCVIEEWLLKIYGFRCVREAEKRFYKRGGESRIALLVAKVVEYFLIADSPAQIRLFTEDLHAKFKLGHFFQY